MYQYFCFARLCRMLGLVYDKCFTFGDKRTDFPLSIFTYIRLFYYFFGHVIVHVHPNNEVIYVIIDKKDTTALPNV